MKKMTPALSAKFANMGLLCACMVVLRHIGLVPNKDGPVWWVWQLFVSYDALTMVAVPFFFLASGFFLGGHIGERNWYCAEVVKRVRSLLVPFFLWNVAFFVFMIGLEFVSAAVGFNPRMPMPAHESFGDVVNAVGLNPFCSPVLGPLWFVRTLFLFVLVSPMLARIWRVSRMVVAFVVMIVVVSFAMRYGTDAVRQIIEYTFSLEGVLYFALGIGLRRRQVGMQVGKHAGRAALWLGILIFVGMALFRRFGGDVFLVPVRLIGTALLMYGMWSVIPERRVLGAYSDIVFPIYLMHKFFLVILAGIVSCLGWREYVTQKSVILYFGRLLVVLLLARLSVSFMRRFVPRIAAWLFGGRG